MIIDSLFIKFSMGFVMVKNQDTWIMEKYGQLNNGSLCDEDFMSRLRILFAKIWEKMRYAKQKLLIFEISLF